MIIPNSKTSTLVKARRRYSFFRIACVRALRFSPEQEKEKLTRPPKNRDGRNVDMIATSITTLRRQARRLRVKMHQGRRTVRYSQDAKRISSSAITNQ